MAGLMISEDGRVVYGMVESGGKRRGGDGWLLAVRLYDECGRLSMYSELDANRLNSYLTRAGFFTGDDTTETPGFEDGLVEDIPDLPDSLKMDVVAAEHVLRVNGPVSGLEKA